MTLGREEFDPLFPHIGFSGSDFDSTGSVSEYGTNLKKAGRSLKDGSSQTALDILEAKVIEVIYDLTGIDLTVLFDTVGGWIDDGIATVKRIVDDILGIFNDGIVTPINSLVQGVKDWWSGLGSWRTDTDSAVTAASTQATIASEDAAVAAAKAAANESDNIRNSTEIANANIALGTKALSSEIPKNVPGHHSLNPLEDVVFPYSDLRKIPTIVSPRTSSEMVYEGGGYHDHAVTTSIVWGPPVYATATMRYDIGYINATRDRIYNTLGFIIAAQAAGGTKSAVALGVYKMDRNAAGFLNGDLTRVWDSFTAEVTNLQATFGTSVQHIRVNLGVDIKALAGDWYAVVIGQYAAGSTPRHLLGSELAETGAISGVHPTRLGMRKLFTATSSMPTTLPVADLDNTSTWMPWMCLGQSIGLNKVSMSDLFDRVNSSALGSNWATYGAGFDIVAGTARCKRIDHGNFTSRKEDRAQGVYVSELATDTMAASVKIDAFDRTNADLEDNPRAQVAVRANADASRCVTVGIRWGLIEIRVYSAANPAGKTMNSTTRTWAAGDVVELRATDDVVTGKTDFTAYVNGSPVLPWTDATDEASKGPAFRRAAFETASTHRGAVFGYLSIPSVGANEWKARDL